MAEQSTVLDLNAMMNDAGSLDSIPEAADFTNPPAGEYVIEVKDSSIESYKAKAKDGNPAYDAQRIKITYAVAETVSTVDNEPPVPDGSLFTETFMATEQGLGFFKKRVKELMNADDLAGVTLGDMLSSIKGTAVSARITIRRTAKPGAPGEFYENLNIRIVKS